MTTEEQRRGDDPEQRSTDELLVHALLLDRLRDTPEKSAARLWRVREAIVPLERRRRWSLVGTRFSLAAAASLVIALGVLLFLTPENQALAGVDQILQRLGEADQTYAIELHEESIDSPPRSAARRPPPGRRPRRALHERYDGAKLFVRGERYALISAEGRRMRFARGFDGRSRWNLGGRRGPGPGAGRTHRVGGGDALALEELLLEVTIDLNELLGEIRADYEVSAPTQVPAEEGFPAMVHYQATPRILRKGGASRILLWADAATGQLDRMICSDLRVHHPRMRYELVITLLGTDPLPERWFTRGAYEE